MSDCLCNNRMRPEQFRHSRREFLARCGMGLGALGLASLLSDELFAAGTPKPVRGQAASFDLIGPRVEMQVSRDGKSLPISEVANFKPGDRIWLHPDFPESQSVYYQLIVAFLRGSTNPPPEKWITQAETWNKKVKQEGILVTVPQDAQQVLVFLAPETGGGMAASVAQQSCIPCHGGTVADWLDTRGPGRQDCRVIWEHSTTLRIPRTATDCDFGTCVGGGPEISWLRNSAAELLLKSKKCRSLPECDGKRRSFRGILGVPSFAGASWQVGRIDLLDHHLQGVRRGRVADEVSPNTCARQLSRLVCDSFDERFDTFWERLRSGTQHLLPLRTCEVLNWHFKYALERKELLILTAGRNGSLEAYAIFGRQDNERLGLKRMRLVDFQCIGESASTIFLLMLERARQRCVQDRLHMLEVVGLGPDRAAAVGQLSPYRRKLDAWRYLYKTNNPQLAEILKNPSVWDPTCYDGDASL